MLQPFDHLTLGGLYGDALRGERAPAVRSAEGMVRFPLLVQACPDEDVIDHPRLALESPERAAIGAVHRDGVKLAPALEATVGVDDSLKQIAHFSYPSFLSRGCQATSGGGIQPPDLFRREGDVARGRRAPESTHDDAP